MKKTQLCICEFQAVVWNLIIIGLVFSAFTVQARTPDPNYYYRLSTDSHGLGMCLDVFNGGGQNNMTLLASCANYSGQFWHLNPTGNGRYRLTTEFRGKGMCLDVFNGGDKNNMTHLVPCANYSGQFWNLKPTGNGRYRLTTDFRGDDICLDIFNGGPRNNQPHLTQCANYSGQFWSLIRTDRVIQDRNTGSGANTQAVTLQFRNQSGADLDVYFDDENGETQFIATVQPGYQLSQPSPVGVSWHLAQDEEWVSGHIATDQPLQIIRYGN